MRVCARRGGLEAHGSGGDVASPPRRTRGLNANRQSHLNMLHIILLCRYIVSLLQVLVVGLGSSAGLGFLTLFADAIPARSFESAPADREGTKKKQPLNPRNWFVFAEGPLARRKTRKKHAQTKPEDRLKSLTKRAAPAADLDSCAAGRTLRRWLRDTRQIKSAGPVKRCVS